MTEDEKSFIRPKSETHAKLLSKVKGQISESYSKISQFYPRWRMRETQFQAYVPTRDWESVWNSTCEDKKLKNIKKQDGNIVVPYTFSTIRTIVTYLANVFLGRKPVFMVGTYNGSLIENAKNMEKLLQYNAEHAKLIKELTQWFYGGEIYGLSILKTGFVTESAPRTTQVIDPLSLSPMRLTQMKIIYQGNTVENIDPFMFFPDPRVPLLEVNKKGEFIYSRSFVGKFALQRAGDTYSYLDAIGELTNGDSGDSVRNMRANGDSLNSQYDFKTISDGSPFVQIDEGTTELIPSEIGFSLGAGFDDDRPHKFLITMANETQIIRFEHYAPDHQMHPFVINEPYSIGNGFGNCGISDYLSPFQEAISWFLNSHIFNVKGVVNNSFLYDPAMIEEKDLKSDAPGKLIRMKPRAFGVDPALYFKQLPISDVTSRHVADMGELMRLGNDISAITDNLRGQQDSGGRKTATEIRASIEAAASRLASHAQFISGASFSDLGKQWCLNLQQYLSPSFSIDVLGEAGAEKPVHIDWANVTGDFYFPVHDGSLPMDKVALFDIWQQALQFIAGNQMLAGSYDVGKVFEFVAKLGGAENIDQFRLNHMPNEVINQQVQAGNLVPINGGMNENLAAAF